VGRFADPGRSDVSSVPLPGALSPILDLLECLVSPAWSESSSGLRGDSQSKQERVHMQLLRATCWLLRTARDLRPGASGGGSWRYS
jgi:hypothetical protein